jgi:hypothetical protein
MNKGFTQWLYDSHIVNKYWGKQRNGKHRVYKKYLHLAYFYLRLDNITAAAAKIIHIITTNMSRPRISLSTGSINLKSKLILKKGCKERGFILFHVALLQAQKTYV